MRTPRSQYPRAFSASLVVLALAAIAPADDKYKGDGTDGGLMPDFPQIWDENQKVTGICDAAANTDATWWLDQHGYRGLVNLTDPKNPNDAWRDDAKSLMYDIANRVYGRDYLAGKTKASLGRFPGAAMTDYVTKMGFAPKNKAGNPSLSIRNISAGDATSSRWQSYIDGKGAAVATMSWRKEDGTFYKLKDGEAFGDVVHCFAGAGTQPEEKQIIVTHGWDDHPGNKPPYKKPPYDDGEKPYIEKYSIRLDKFKKAEVWKEDNEKRNLFGYGAHHLYMDSFLAYSPVQGVNMQNNRRQPGKNGMSYGYSVENLDFEPVYQVVLELQVGIDFNSVASPDGWKAIPWNPLDTIDVSPRPAQLSEPGHEQDEGFSHWESETRGILWYTDDPNKAISLGNSLDGFLFEASDEYPVGDLGLIGGASNGRSNFIDPSSDRLTTEFQSVSGPIPEPTTLGLIAFAAALLSVRRRVV